MGVEALVETTRGPHNTSYNYSDFGCLAGSEFDIYSDEDEIITLVFVQLLLSQTESVAAPRRSCDSHNRRRRFSLYEESS